MIPKEEVTKVSDGDNDNDLAFDFNFSIVGFGNTYEYNEYTTNTASRRDFH